jgi:hypothetical protein
MVRRFVIALATAVALVGPAAADNKPSYVWERHTQSIITKMPRSQNVSSCTLDMEVTKKSTPHPLELLGKGRVVGDASRHLHGRHHR